LSGSGRRQAAANTSSSVASGIARIPSISASLMMKGGARTMAATAEAEAEGLRLLRKSQMEQLDACSKELAAAAFLVSNWDAVIKFFRT
jgi:hypothetical protein